MSQINDDNQPKSFQLGALLLPPLLTILMIVLLNRGYHHYATFFAPYIDLANLDLAENVIFWLGLGWSVFWLVTRLINRLTHYLLTTPFALNHPTVQLIIPFCASITKTIAILIIVNNLTIQVGLPDAFSNVLEKLSSILIIGAITWILVKIINIAEQLLFHYYAVNTNGDITARKLYTQTTIIRRVLLALITILALGAMLMLFDNVRALGASVLTTAGIIGLVLTFTAQRSLASIFSGLEIALTQPIKIGDAIVIENEFGVVEEINFRSVIVKLWDWRRLVVPTSYFLEKPFQNWSRDTVNNLIGTVYLYVDFTLSVPVLREQLTLILTQSPLWDGNVSGIQVSDLQERVMQLRVLASARSSADAWNLRCEVREKLMAYLANHQPLWLPTARTKSLRQTESDSSSS